MPLPDVFGVGQPTSSPPGKPSGLPNVFGTAAPSSGSLPDVFGGSTAPAPTAPAPSDSNEGFSPLGFLGNVSQEIGDMVKGVGSLIGKTAQDLGHVGLFLVPGTQASEDEEFQLAETVRALPKALAQDYNTRYGISKFAEGDIWGGLKAIATGIYERPLSFAGDVLMVGSGAKVAAKAGVLGDTLGARVLGPGSVETMSLTGGEIATGSTAGVTSLTLSQNPVARLAQQKLYDVLTYGNGASDKVAGVLGMGTPETFISKLDDIGESGRAQANLAMAGERPILRPTISRFVEKRGVSTAMSILNMGVGDRAGAASKKIRGLITPEEVDADLFVSGAHGTKAVALGDQIPSALSPVGYSPANELFDVPDVAIPATPGVEGPAWTAAAGELKGDLIRLEPSMRHQILSPHDLTGSESNRALIVVDDMNDAANQAQRYAQSIGGKVVGRKNYFAVSDSSYDGIHYSIESPSGAIHDVSIATPDLIESQKAWSHMALQAQSKADEINALRRELAVTTSAGQGMHIEQDIVNATDELQAIEVFNSHTFDFTRRVMNGGDYDSTLAALDRARNVVYNNATRDEIGHGLTFRKAIDRSFGAIRSEKWSNMMRQIEEGLTARIEEGLAGGASKESLIGPIIEHVESILGPNNPWTESMFRSYVDEVIPFETGYTVGGTAAPAVAKAAPAAPKAPAAAAKIPPVPDEVGDAAVWARSYDPDVVADAAAHPGAFSETDKSIALYKKLGVTEPWNEWEWPRRLAEHRLYDEKMGIADDVVRAQADDIPDMAPAPAPKVEPARTATFRGRLATGEKTILSDARALRARKGSFDAEGEWVDATAAEQAAEIANRLTNKLRGITHESMVVNGEFTGLDYQSLMREQVLGGMPIPQYYPHIRASKATGDVVMGNMHDQNLPSIIESETSRMRKWEGDLYEQGLIERDPIRAYEQLFRTIQHHTEFRDFMNTVVRKYGRKVPDAELDNWRFRQQGEVLVSQNGINGMTDGRAQLATLKHEGVMGGKSIEDATMDALDTLQAMAEESWAAGAAGDEIFALPRHVAQFLKKSAQRSGTAPKFNFYYDTAMGLWKSSVLSLSPRWVVNNTLGNLVYMGVHNPGAIRYFLGQLTAKGRARARVILGEAFSGEIERDFMHGEMQLSADARLALRAERAGVQWGKDLAANEALQASRPITTLRAVSNKVRNVNTYIEDAARRGVALNELRKANIRGVAGRFVSTKQLLEDVAGQGLPSQARFDKVIEEVNNTLGDYLTMSPVESQIIRRYVMPFYAFYRHTAKFVARMPFEHPLKMKLLEQITMMDRQMNPYMPDYMLGAANIGGLFVRFGGANPLEAVTGAYAPSITHPLAGLAIQRLTGTNPFGGQWYPPEGAMVETSGGGRFAILRGPDGQVTGVRQMEGQWAPPLYESVLSLLPQAGLLFDPWDRAVSKRLVGLTGASISSYDPAEAAYFGAKDQLEALKRAMSSAPPP